MPIKKKKLMTKEKLEIAIKPLIKIDHFDPHPICLARKALRIIMILLLLLLAAAYAEDSLEEVINNIHNKIVDKVDSEYSELTVTNNFAFGDQLLVNLPTSDISIICPGGSSYDINKKDLYSLSRKEAVWILETIVEGLKFGKDQVCDDLPTTMERYRRK